MRYKIKQFTALSALLVGMLLAQGQTGSKSSIIADGATPHLVSSQFVFTEGPTTDKKGNVFFTDQPNNKIWKYDTDGKLSVFMDNAGRSNGMYFDPNGNLISCADEKNEIWSIAPDGKVTVILKDYKGKLLNGPNDVWVDAKGGIYLTDPYYYRKYWQHTESQLDGEKVYYMKKGGTPEIVIDNMEKPNGIVGTPDGKFLYVADIKGNKTFKYTIERDGSLSNPQLFANLGSDGITIDNLGNIYLTGKGVTVFNPQGEQIEQIDIPESWTANATFGGSKKNLLFITAMKSVYTLEMKVKGVQ